MTGLSVHGEVFATLLEKVVGEAISPKSSSLQQEGQGNVGIKGEYERVTQDEGLTMISVVLLKNCFL